jgi:hypothetical protein
MILRYNRKDCRLFRVLVACSDPGGLVVPYIPQLNVGSDSMHPSCLYPEYGLRFCSFNTYMSPSN